MKPEEIIILNKLAEAWNNFNQLTEYHKSDKHEFLTAIHTCQTIVMARQAVRQNPDLFKTEQQHIKNQYGV